MRKLDISISSLRSRLSEQEPATLPQVFENYVVAEIAKTLANSGDVGQLWFYRDRDAGEIDAVIERVGTLYPMEIKRSANPRHIMSSSMAVRP